MTKFKIFTWNFGKQTNEKLECITQMFENIELNTIYVFGLQEVRSKDYKYILNHFEDKVKEINGYKIINKKKYSSFHPFKRTSEFDLVTFIIYPKDIIIIDNKQKSHKVASSKSVLNLFDTKGYLSIDLMIDNINYTLVNVHLPFQDEELSKQNFEMLYKTFDNRDNIIIFGDYNTRSKFDDTCLKNNPCDIEFTKNVDKENVEELQKNLNNCQKHILCTDIEEKLTDKDYLNEVKDGIMEGYTEDEIHFLPSYKVDKDTGEYSLIKEGQGRLAGYADRILVKGEDLQIVKGSYKLGDCSGNDHFPVMLDVELTHFVNNYGGKTKRRKRGIKKTRKRHYKKK